MKKKAAAKKKRRLPGSHDVGDFDLPNMLSHLLRRAHFNAEAQFAETLGKNGLTSRQLALLVTIAQNKGATQSHLGEMIGIDRNTISEMVARMTDKKLIKQTVSAKDRRYKELSLTAAAHRILTDTAINNPDYQDAIASELTSAERTQLARLLKKMIRI